VFSRTLHRELAKKKAKKNFSNSSLQHFVGRVALIAYAPLPTAHFDRNKTHAISGTGY
jgi:hypothetical protein